MSVLKQLRRNVSTKIYNRGRNYYQTGRVVDYDYQIINDQQLEIKAEVSGTKLYQVKIEINLKNKKVYPEGQCNCPYDWGPICKHEIAVLYKFLEEDYPTLNFNRLTEVNYNKLVGLSQQVRTKETASLQFVIKGLMTSSMVNFKLVLQSEELEVDELERIIAYIQDSYYSGLDSFKDRLTSKDLAQINYLAQVETKGSQTEGALLFSKDEANFNFLLGLIEDSQVYLAESDQLAEVGQLLYPKLIMTGDLSKVKIKIKDSNYQTYQGNGITWTVQEAKVHPVEMETIRNAPTQIPIPEKKQGEFIFEVLPSLQQNLNLEVAQNLEGYQLIEKEPQIRLKFDYQEQTIICQSEVKIDQQIYHNTEIVGFDYDAKHYQQDEQDPKVWSAWNTAKVKQFLNFLEDYEFHLQPDCFSIKDETDQQRFITEDLADLSAEWEVETTPDFEELEVVPCQLEPVIEFVEDDDNINWFEFKITYNIGAESYTKAELEELLKYNQQGEGYLQLDNKYYLIEEDNQQQVEQMIAQADKQEDGSYRSSYYQLLYYRNLVQEAGISFTGNQVYDQLDRDITQDNLVQEVELPTEVEDILRDYQKQGYYWLKFLAKYHFGGILADDMGLGKTLQTLTLLKSMGHNQPALIICPRTLIYNWGVEVDKFFSDFDYLVYYGTPQERAEMRQDFSKYQLIITSYSIISRDYLELGDFKFSHVILDEAHYIKNRTTKRAKGVKEITAEYRLALTGTPLENSLEELWSIFDFIMPGYLNSYSQFRKKYLNPITKDQDETKLVELKKRIAPFILRRRKEEVLADLPDKLINIHPVEMTKVQEDSYRMILEQVKTDLTAQIEERGFNRSRINILAALTKLRQICNHPSLILEESEQQLSSAKLDALLEIVQAAIAGGHKIVVFSQFVKMLKIIRQGFEKQEIPFTYLDGSTRNRMERVEKFNADDQLKVFLISLKAGGTGLNLTSANIVIHVDPWWNPMVERQATDRTHRIGQTKQVTVYKLITTGTVEEKMLKLQQRKQDIFESIIEKNSSPIQSISWEDIQDLLEYN
ncbi:SNF2-related protein [Natroniella sulfidigena]|uniref:SNF2-related protein n=1 Tax=Natroniella sulfidigena TaxID=723921 RepID=UPI00200A9F2C|nr:SNF2-related protein [Natroniella sulfidigena]MCK8816278.1 SNF2-related protein [Natroniella sulfidigena]